MALLVQLLDASHVMVPVEYVAFALAPNAEERCISAFGIETDLVELYVAVEAGGRVFIHDCFHQLNKNNNSWIGNFFQPTNLIPRQIVRPYLQRILSYRITVYCK